MNESNRIEKDWVGVPHGLVWGKGRGGWCDFVCRKRLEVIGLFFTHGEFAFTSMGL